MRLFIYIFLIISNECWLLICYDALSSSSDVLVYVTFEKIVTACLIINKLQNMNFCENICLGTSNLVTSLQYNTYSGESIKTE